MKERVVVFGDAIIAIIITIIVLELPIHYGSNGAVNLTELFRAIAIYFISFCFVANVWFQTAYGFNRIEEVKNRNLVVYMLLLFALSLVPSATRLLIEDTTRQTVLIYGILSFIVTMISRRLLVALEMQAITEEKQKFQRRDELNRQDLAMLVILLALLIFGWFFYRFALVIYLIMPILAFLQNIVDREENQFVDSLDHEERQEYFDSRKEIWGNSVQRYSKLLRDSLKDSSQDPEKFQAIMTEWQRRLGQDIATKKQALAQELDHKNQQKINSELKNLERMQANLTQRQRHSFNKNRQHP